jgi:hypothetical protein
MEIGSCPRIIMEGSRSVFPPAVMLRLGGGVSIITAKGHRLRALVIRMKVMRGRRRSLAA